MQSLHPKTVWLFFFTFVLRGLFIFIFFSIWAGPMFAVIFGITGGKNAFGFILSLLGSWIIIFVFFVLFCYGWARLTYKYWKYELTEDAFKKESGVIWKKYVSIPYDRIQNVDIYRGIFARILGLSDVQVQTAGSSAIYSGRGGLAGIGAEGRLPGIGKEDAEKLRDELIKRAKNLKQSI